jgi:hypothetical protein
MARAKFQYAGISWHQPKSSITVYFGSPAYQGIFQITHIAIYFGMPAYHGIL